MTNAAIGRMALGRNAVAVGAGEFAHQVFAAQLLQVASGSTRSSGESVAGSLARTPCANYTCAESIIGRWGQRQHATELKE
jgi:hypothetical protein